MDGEIDRFDLYGALWLFCSRYHGGQTSRGYRLLSKLSRAGYNPGFGLQRGNFETDEQLNIYYNLVKNYGEKM